MNVVCFDHENVRAESNWHRKPMSNDNEMDWILMIPQWKLTLWKEFN